MTVEFDGDAAVEALTKLGVLKRACPMCGEKEPWDVGDDGFFEVTGLSPGSAEEAPEDLPSIGTVALQCRNCGFVALHSRTGLGLGDTGSAGHDQES